MYNDDCLPDASVKLPRRADRAARREISARLSCSDMGAEQEGWPAQPVGSASN